MISKATSPDNYFCQVFVFQAYHDSQCAVNFDDNFFGSLSQTVHAASDDPGSNDLKGQIDDDV
jgi:hypothetical protein